MLRNNFVSAWATCGKMRLGYVTESHRYQTKKPLSEQGRWRLPWGIIIKYGNNIKLLLRNRTSLYIADEVRVIRTIYSSSLKLFCSEFWYLLVEVVSCRFGQTAKIGLPLSFSNWPSACCCVQLQFVQVQAKNQSVYQDYHTCSIINLLKQEVLTYYPI